MIRQRRGRRGKNQICLSDRRKEPFSPIFLQPLWGQRRSRAQKTGLIESRERESQSVPPPVFLAEETVQKVEKNEFLHFSLCSDGEKSPPGSPQEKGLENEPKEVARDSPKKSMLRIVFFKKKMFPGKLKTVSL